MKRWRSLIVFFAAFVALLLPRATLAGIDSIPDENQVILPATHIDLLTPQSRIAITGPGWTPSPEQTHQALAAVVKFLHRPRPEWLIAEDVARILSNPAPYRIQFTGIEKEGRCMILCVFFDEVPSPKWKRDWKTEPVLMPDGGYHCWSIVYDVARGECSDFGTS
jgi:hypothetical protein